MKSAVLIATLLAASALVPAAARADGDPASDVLITDRVFFPSTVMLVPGSAEELTRAVVEAERQDYAVRVALIANDFDLGAVGALWRKPQIYSKFLAQELANFNTDWVLVVMPNGYGIYRCVPKPRPGGYVDPCEGGMPADADERALEALPTPESSNQDVVVAAAGAVRLLASLHGAPVRETSGKPYLVLIVVGAMALLTIGAALALQRRSRRARTSPIATPDTEG